MKNVMQYLDFHRLEPEQREQLLINCIIGIVILLVSIVLEDSTWGRKNVNLQFDTFILEEASNVKGQHDTRISPEIVFFDIDNITYQKWGRPNLTPRDKVAQLMEIAYEGGARVIVSDINVEEPDYTPTQSLEGEPSLSGLQRDQRLRQVLEDIKLHGGNTKVILPAISYTDKTLRRNIFDDLIDNHIIYRGTPASVRDEYDQVTRYWLPFQEYINNKGERDVLWSSPLLAVILANGGDIEDLKEQAETVEQYCEANHKPFLLEMKNSQQKIQLYTEVGSQYNRIRYFLLPENILTPNGTLYAVNQRKTSSGMEVFTTTNPSYSLKGKIVIIGNSSPEYNDMHMTPVGNIPGMYVQGNVINTLLQNQQISISHPVLHYIVEVILIILASYIFLYFHSFAAQLLLSGFIISLLPIFYYIFLSTGIFFDLAFPLLGIGFHELFAKTEQLFVGKKHR